MNKTRPAPVDAGFLHAFNDAFIFISSASLVDEIEVFSKALHLIDAREPEASVEPEVEFVVEQLSLLLVENVQPPLAAALSKQLMNLDAGSKQLIRLRLEQLIAVIQANKVNRFGDTYVVSPIWHRRWLDLIACRVLHADVICLDLDDYQP